MPENNLENEVQRQRQEDMLRERQLRAFSAAASRSRNESTGEAAILTSQPRLSEGLRKIAQLAEEPDTDGSVRSPSDAKGCVNASRTSTAI